MCDWPLVLGGNLEGLVIPEIKPEENSVHDAMLKVQLSGTPNESGPFCGKSMTDFIAAR